MGLLDFGVAAVEDIGANLQEMLVDGKFLVIAILFREIDENVFHLHRDRGTCSRTFRTNSWSSGYLISLISQQKILGILLF